MLFTNYHPLDATIISLSSEFGCPIIGGTGLEVLLNHYGAVHRRVRSDNDIDFLDVDHDGTARLMKRLRKLGFDSGRCSADDAMVTFSRPGIEVDILLDGGGVAPNADVFGSHLAKVGQLLILNECGMLFSKCTRVIDLQNGLDSGFGGNTATSSAAAKIKHDLGDMALLKLLMAQRNSYAEYRSLVEAFAPPSLSFDGDEPEPSPYFTLLY